MDIRSLIEQLDEITRRGFLKGLAATGASAVAGANIPKAQAQNFEYLYDKLYKGMPLEDVQKIVPNTKSGKPPAVVTGLGLASEGKKYLVHNTNAPLNAPAQSYLEFTNNALSKVIFIIKYKNIKVGDKYAWEPLNKEQSLDVFKELARKVNSTEILGSPGGQISFNDIQAPVGLGASLAGVLGEPKYVGFTLPFSKGMLALTAVTYNYKDNSLYDLIISIGSTDDSMNFQLEETSDDAIARIVELSKDIK
jgi:hypothetical protein